MKIVINNCFGGFNLSDRAIEMIMRRKGFECFRYAHTKYKFSDGVDEYVKQEKCSGVRLFPPIYYSTKDFGDKTNELSEDAIWDENGVSRNDTDLVAVVEEIGKEASNTEISSLAVVEIPDGVNWTIQEYDGLESVHEAHRVWTA